MAFNQSQRQDAGLIKQEFRFYNYMVLTCFKACVRGFDNNTLSESEAKCGENCCKKVLASFDKIQESVNKQAENQTKKNTIRL